MCTRDDALSERNKFLNIEIEFRITKNASHKVNFIFTHLGTVFHQSMRTDFQGAMAKTFTNQKTYTTKYEWSSWSVFDFSRKGGKGRCLSGIRFKFIPKLRSTNRKSPEAKYRYFSVF